MDKLIRICLVTWMGSGNYGTSLQSFALHYKLQSLGYDVTFLNSVPGPFTIRFYLKSFLKKIGLIKTAIPNSVTQTKKNKFLKFNRDYYNVPNFTSRKQWLEYVKNNIFITGSDQIWNTYYKFNPFYFLSFVKNSKKIAYASSIGTDTVNPKYQENVRCLLNEFSHIAVREESSVRVLSDLTGRKDIISVLDPTLLLTKAEWHQILVETDTFYKIDGKYILCYLVGNNPVYYDQVKIIRDQFPNCMLVIIPSEENKEFVLSNALVLNDVGPLEFVFLLEHATFVCTDSFHASAFCINLNVDFVELLRFIDNCESSQNSRIYCLLDKFNLRCRLFDDSNIECCSHIDFIPSREIMERNRKFSLNYLIESINC